MADIPFSMNKTSDEDHTDADEQPLHTQNPGADDHDAGRTPNSSRAALDLLTPSSGSRKPRGRPPGSKNKPKPPVYITKEAEPAMKARQLEIAAGSDVVDMVEKFARKHRLGVHVISGSGTISSFTLQQPPITLTGSFNLLSLTGTYLGMAECADKKKEAPATIPYSGWMTIFVGGGEGEVFGGNVSGQIMAASDVLLNVSTFGLYEFHRVEPSDFYEDEEDDGEGSDRGRLAGEIEESSVSPVGHSLGFAVPASHLNWTPNNNY